jgi:hypothetical protein
MSVTDCLGRYPHETYILSQVSRTRKVPERQQAVNLAARIAAL